MISRNKKYIVLILTLLISVEVKSQATVFGLFKNNVTNADEYFNNKDYYSAIKLYEEAKKRQNSPNIDLKIAQGYFFLKDYKKSISAYESYIKKGEELSLDDIFRYAEANASVEDYDKAVVFYKKYLEKDPNNELIFKKIWRLNNIRFLYEDSLFYAIRHLPLNSKYSDISAVPYKEGVVFTSNRKKLSILNQIDASLNAPFYNLYFSKSLKKNVSENLGTTFAEPAPLNHDFNFKYHIGPAAFYDNYSKMVFVASESSEDNGQSNTLKIFFANQQEDRWRVTGQFPFNSHKYSCQNPTISEDGKTLYFSSDMAGGAGGMDIYRSDFIKGKWTKPENVGEKINTVYDEIFPYLHRKITLYFSSNGHAGLGGLDIFKVDIHQNEYSDAENVGYPLNSHLDDFGITIDSFNMYGYLTSNRLKGGYNDDIFEFEMDIQPYPVEITGIIKYIEHNWSDSSELNLLPNVKLVLIDNVRNVKVAETNSDKDGNFLIRVPYYSEYKLRVIGKNVGEGIVSFVVPKHRNQKDMYEIVVVKDDFKTY